MRRDRAQAVVAGVAAARLDAHFTGRQVELVVEHQDVGVGDFEKALALLYGAAAVVHVGLRLQQQHPPTGNVAVAGQAMKALFPWPEPVPRGNAIERHEANVVAMARVGAARIAKANKQLHVTLVRSEARRTRGAPLLFLAGGRLGGGRFGRLFAGGSLARRRFLASGRSLAIAGSRSRRGLGSFYGSGALDRSGRVRGGGGFVFNLVPSDGRHREVAVEDGRLDAVGHSGGGDVHRASDLQALEIEFEVIGDGISWRRHLDLVAHDVEDATTLEPG